MTELVREDNYALSRSYKFTYDNGGNIVRKETYYITEGTIADTPTRTDTYDYETVTSGYGQNAAWKDQLKSYNGTAIRYDESGNPLNYLGKVMTWRGRKLTSIDGIAMDYDYNGLRVRKGDKTYYWQSGNLIMERWVKNGEENYIYYYYDESGVCGMNYNGTEYYYRKNILGDVIAIYDRLGNLQCKYVYDAWGNHKVYNASGSEIGAEVLNIGNVNSIRYRGYYWDKEFGLYYLQSRYYDPMLGRFISADSINYLKPENVGGFNLYIFCNNNPKKYVDPTGHSWESFWNGVGDWFKNTFSGYVDLSKNIINNVHDFLFFGYEEGINMISTLGDDSKPISFYVTNASEWWKVSEYQIGVKLNIGKFSFSSSVGLGETNISFAWDNSSFDFQGGINKIGVGTTQSIDGVSYYNQYYIRTIPTAAVVLIAIFAPQLLPVAVPFFA